MTEPLSADGPPLISLVVPVYRTPPEFLNALIDSVREQTFGQWQLILVDDGSDDALLREQLLDAAAADDRIVVSESVDNAGIVAATQRGIERAAGVFVGFADHDDVLDHDALAVLAAAIEANPDADVLYTDEDQLHDPDPEPRAVFRKPDYSPERLRGQMYFGHLTVYRRALLLQIGGLRTGYDGSQDYDLALRAVEVARSVVHVPYVAYHWRIHDASVSHRPDNEAVFDAARRALADHLARTGVDGRIEQVHEVGVYRTRRTLPSPPPVSILLPTKGSRGPVRGTDTTLVLHAVESVVNRSSYPDYEIVVLADDVMPESVADDLVAIAGPRLRIVPFSGPFNFSRKINHGALEAANELLLLLNDDIEIITPDWIETMVGAVQPDDVGMVGAKLLYEDDTVQHAGLVYENFELWHVGARTPGWWPGPSADFLLDREVSGVTGACALVKRSVFVEVGGLSLELPIAFNDVDLSLKMTGAGYRIVYTPHARLYHFESMTRERYVTATEVTTFRNRWHHRLAEDPFWKHAPDDVAAAMTAALS